MSWHGRQYAGAMRDRRKDKRHEADERAARAAARKVIEALEPGFGGEQ